MDKIKCNHCGQEFKVSELYNIDTKFYCDKCINIFMIEIEYIIEDLET